MTIEMSDLKEGLLTPLSSINYYAPQIFKSVGLSGGSAGLFATGIYGIVKIVVTAVGLMVATEQLGRKWSLIIGGTGQAFAMFYIGKCEINDTF
jgi:SP family sugar:H+ symporter-like MFS transporter